MIKTFPFVLPNLDCSIGNRLKDYMIQPVPVSGNLRLKISLIREPPRFAPIRLNSRLK
jgi:hypothetical protein